MTNLYNLLKSRAMRSQIQTAASDSVSQTLQSLPRMNTNNTRVPMSGINSFPSNGSRPMVPQSTRLTSRHFNALPSPEFQTLSSGAERLSKHQRSGGSSSREKLGRLGKHLESMPPPKLPFGGKSCLYPCRTALTFKNPSSSTTNSNAVLPSYTSPCCAAGSLCTKWTRTNGTTNIDCRLWSFQRLYLQSRLKDGHYRLVRLFMRGILIRILRCNRHSQLSNDNIKIHEKDKPQYADP